jgi:HSP20 family protein
MQVTSLLYWVVICETIYREPPVDKVGEPTSTRKRDNAMDLVAWKPFRDELSAFRKEMDRLWNRAFGETALGRVSETEWRPSADIAETPESITVIAELPGLEPKDIEVTLSGDLLTIKGEKKKEEKKQHEKYYYAERLHGMFERSFRLPVGVKMDKVEAKFDKGVLTITLPKTEDAKTKEIKVPIN